MASVEATKYDARGRPTRDMKWRARSGISTDALRRRLGGPPDSISRVRDSGGFVESSGSRDDTVGVVALCRPPLARNAGSTVTAGRRMSATLHVLVIERWVSYRRRRVPGPACRAQRRRAWLLVMPTPTADRFPPSRSRNKWNSTKWSILPTAKLTRTGDANGQPPVTAWAPVAASSARARLARARCSDRVRSGVFVARRAARSNSAAASAWRPSLSRRSPRTL